MRLRRFAVALLILTVTAFAAAPASAEVAVYNASLSGANEIPPRDTFAFGHATFVTSWDGERLDYWLVVANIENVVASHIHLGGSDENGPVVAFLYGPAAPGGGFTSGVLASGAITADDLVGPLAGQPLSALIAEIDAGNAYVNVHTNDGVEPPNTGPGDFPGGEIRGQLY